MTDHAKSFQVIIPANNSVIARCDHEGDARRIASLWARQYKREMQIAFPEGRVVRVSPSGDMST